MIRYTRAWGARRFWQAWRLKQGFNHAWDCQRVPRLHYLAPGPKRMAPRPRLVTFEVAQ